MSIMEETARHQSVPSTLRGRLVYFAHPIDLNQLNHRQSRACAELLRMLQELGAVVYDPAGAFSADKATPPNAIVQDMNRTAIHKADLIVACYPETPGVGVAMEIQLADMLGKPSLVLTDVGTKSWALAGLVHGRTTSVVNQDVFDWMVEEAAEYAAVAGQRGDELRVRADHPHFMPTRKHSTDCAFDLVVSSETTIGPGEIRDVPAGCAVQFPDDAWGLILGRSSTSRTHHLLVHPGVIDTGYRGQLFAQVENMNDYTFVIADGMRLAQIIPLPNLAAGMDTREVDALAPSDRGDNGLGSTGL